MDKLRFRFLSFFTLFIYSFFVQANTQPTFSIIPTTATRFQVADNSINTVIYQVTNNTKITRALTFVPIVGTSQKITVTTSCNSPFILAPQQSCQLTLQINGSQVPVNGIHGGPVVCKTKGPNDDSPDPFLCSQPSSASILNINKISGLLANITINPTSLTLIAGSNTPGIITVTNTSTILFANNIQATLPASWTDVIQDASNCVSLPPGGTCQLRFTPGSMTHPTALVPIAGVNTNQVFASISVQLQTFAYIPGGGATGFVTLCDVNNTAGFLFGCRDSGAGNIFVDPIGLALNSTNTFLYVTNTGGAHRVSVCSRNVNTGVISGCQNAGGSFAAPTDVVIRGNLAYVTDGIGLLQVCTINPSTGLFSVCLITTVSNTKFIAFNSAGTIAYLTSGNSVIRCDVDQATGLLVACVDSGVGSIFNGPEGIQVNNSNTLAYVSNFINGTISICAINSTGFFTSCANSSQVFNQPNGIVLNAMNTFLYVNNTQTNVTSQCSIDVNGGLLSCVNSGATNIISPTGITLST